MRDYTRYTDDQLVLLLGGSDQEAFTELYNRYHAGIYNYQLSFVKIPSISEDLTQEVFLKIWEARQRIHIHTSLASYIYRVSRNTAIDFMKKITADRALRNEIILHHQSFLPDSSSSPLQLRNTAIYICRLLIRFHNNNARFFSSAGKKEKHTRRLPVCSAFPAIR